MICKNRSRNREVLDVLGSFPVSFWPKYCIPKNFHDFQNIRLHFWLCQPISNRFTFFDLAIHLKCLTFWLSQPHSKIGVFYTCLVYSSRLLYPPYPIYAYKFVAYAYCFAFYRANEVVYEQPYQWSGSSHGESLEEVQWIAWCILLGKMFVVPRVYRLCFNCIVFGFYNFWRLTNMVCCVGPWSWRRPML